MGIVESLCDQRDKTNNEINNKILYLNNKLTSLDNDIDNVNNNLDNKINKLNILIDKTNDNQLEVNNKIDILIDKTNDIDKKINLNKLGEENKLIKQCINVLEEEMIKLNKLENDNIKKIDELDENVCKNNICIVLLEEDIIEYKLSTKGINKNI
jgi:hypothetical protein